MISSGAGRSLEWEFNGWMDDQPQSTYANLRGWDGPATLLGVGRKGKGEEVEVLELLGVLECMLMAGETTVSLGLYSKQGAVGPCVTYKMFMVISRYLWG
jgi:hypothetical protein